MSDHGPDLGEAVDYILAERPKLWEDDVWAVVNELQDPPAAASDRLALALLAERRPDVAKKDAKLILREWRAYAALAIEPDWDDDDD